jgi:hypothetical protein
LFDRNRIHVEKPILAVDVLVIELGVIVLNAFALNFTGRNLATREDEKKTPY